MSSHRPVKMGAGHDGGLRLGNRTEQAQRRHDRAQVVRDLTLTVSSGEVVALLGVNDAGKTTTLRAISGLLKHGAGAVRLGG
jgi:branched-chain amino acid transport system ATP-binding protein